jgi:hypothetical protein
MTFLYLMIISKHIKNIIILLILKLYNNINKMSEKFLDEYLLYPNEFNYISSKKIDLRPVNKFKMKKIINKTKNIYQKKYLSKTKSSNIDMDYIIDDEYNLLSILDIKNEKINIKYPKIISIYGIIKYIN